MIDFNSLKYTTAGQIGPLEWILIIIGILWVAGYLRNIVYVPVIVKEKEEKKKAEETQISKDVSISKPKTKGDNDDYVPFEEIKE